MVDANIGPDGRVMLAVRSGVDKRGSASPIFIRSVREENLGDDIFGRRAIEQAAFLVGNRIDLGLIRERKNICVLKYGLSWLRIVRGLRESIVETATARAGHMRQYAIESDAAIFIGIESLIKKIAQESAIL